MQKVAQIAGVSTSTVSRVINDYPRVAASTVESVRRAMKQISFTPTVRRSATVARNARGIRSANIGFLVFGSEDSQAAPAFQLLLRGISGSCTQQDLNLIFSIVHSPSELPPKIEEGRVDGLLLHGARPDADVQAKLCSFPTVWLMANRQRPTWGDQVLPDNTAIGELAAQYLLGRGHRRLAYLSADSRAWSFEIRSFSFARTARDAGAEAFLLNANVDRSAAAHGHHGNGQTASDLWLTDTLPASADQLVQQLLELDPRPTGLFVAEDRLLHVLEAAMAKRGVRSGADIEIVSCNNERPYLVGLENIPATIDIRAESIGRRGVEQLLWRMANPNVPERIRCMVEPILVEAAT